MAGVSQTTLQSIREERWRPHKVAAFVVRLMLLAVPVVTGAVVGVAVGDVAGRHGLGAAGLLLVLAASAATVLVVERATRRLLPLAGLLRLTLVFPDRAPSRVRVALRAGNLRRLQRYAAEHGPVEDGAADAAEQVLSLVTALNAHDRKTRGHSERVRALAEVIGTELGLEPAELDRLRWAALLHDVGKLSVPTSILNKAGKPNPSEWARLQEHPIDGLRLLGPLADWLGPWAGGIDEHHERWDGKGYPYGRTGAEVSLAGRIVAVADVFETMTEVRSYQRPRSFAAARAELTLCAGSQFDPQVVRALHNVSLGRLHWVMGPLSWIAQVPFLGQASHAVVDLAGVTPAANVATIAKVASAAALMAAPASSPLVLAAHGPTRAATPTAQIVLADAGTPTSGPPSTPGPARSGTPVSTPTVAAGVTTTKTPAATTGSGAAADARAPATTSPATVADRPTGAPAAKRTTPATTPPTTMPAAANGGQGAPSLPGAVGGVTGGVANGVTNTVGGATNGVTSTVGGITNGVTNAVGGATSGVNDTVGNVEQHLPKPLGHLLP